MASWAPAACMCWAMAQAMLRLLATPNTTTVRPSMLIGIRESSSAGAIELIGAIFKDISRKVGCLGELCRPTGIGFSGWRATQRLRGCYETLPCLRHSDEFSHFTQCSAFGCALG